MSEKKTPVLETKELGIDFGGLTAVNDLDLSIYDEEIVGLIGPNGAGKTTVFNLLTKVYTPTRGQIIFDGKDTAGKTVVDINRAGIARTFQNIRLFDNMTVLDNVRTAYHNNIKYSPVSAVFRLPAYYAKEREIEGKSRELLEIMELGEYAEVTAARHGDRAQAPPAGRAGRRHESPGDRGSHEDDPLRARPLQDCCPPHRA